MHLPFIQLHSAEGQRASNRSDIASCNVPCVTFVLHIQLIRASWEVGSSARSAGEGGTDEFIHSAFRGLYFSVGCKQILHFSITYWCKYGSTVWQRHPYGRCLDKRNKNEPKFEIWNERSLKFQILSKTRNYWFVPFNTGSLMWSKLFG
jgi:hypothetical protein